MNDLLFHPAFQSVAVPGVLSALGFGVLRFVLPTAQRRWADAAAVLSLAASLALLPGWHWPAASAVQKLPWILAGGLALAVVAEATHAAAWTHWAGAALGWALASQWLAGAWATTPTAVAHALAGAAVLAALTAVLTAGRPAAAGVNDTLGQGGAAAAATLAVASLGLAGLAAVGGSLLLAQLAAMVATVSGVLAALGLWAGLRRGPGGAARAPAPAAAAGPLALMPLGMAWLAIAQVASTAGVGAAALGVLALAFVLPLALPKRRPPSSVPSAWSPVLAALAAAVPAAAAIGWQAAAPAGGPAAPTGAEDPYYEPRWK